MNIQAFQVILNKIIDLVQEINIEDDLEGTINISMKDGTAYVTRSSSNENIKEESQIDNSILKIKGGSATFLINHFDNGKITLLMVKQLNDVQEENK